MAEAFRAGVLRAARRAFLCAPARPAQARRSALRAAACLEGSLARRQSEAWTQGRLRVLAALGAGGVAAAVGMSLQSGEALANSLPSPRASAAACEEEEGQDETCIVNFSGTHEATTSTFLCPESLEELEAVVRAAHATGQRLRVVGSGLSPNGIGLSDEGMVNLGSMNKVLWVDTESRLACVQAGARITDVVEALRPHGMTLENYASINEQTLGGFYNAGCHGTGAAIPPCEEQVVAIRIVTPGEGTKVLSAHTDPELFQMAKVGLGCLVSWPAPRPTPVFPRTRSLPSRQTGHRRLVLFSSRPPAVLGCCHLHHARRPLTLSGRAVSQGVVAEYVIRCVPAHNLVERTSVLTRAEVRRGHGERLRANKHVRYMWVPYTDAVVVVACNPAEEDGGEVPQSCPLESPLAPFRELALSLDPGMQRSRLEAMSFADLRDHVLGANKRTYPFCPTLPLKPPIAPCAACQTMPRLFRGGHQILLLWPFLTPHPPYTHARPSTVMPLYSRGAP